MKDEKPGWDYKPDGDPKADIPDDAQPALADTPDDPTSLISWTASEFIDHNQGMAWYMALLGGTAVLTAGVYVLTRDYFASATVPVVGILVGIFVRHKPRQIKYELTSSGLRAGDKFYNWRTFKSFSIVPDGALMSISLTPTKKFMPAISAYFDPADQQKIVDVLSDKLPYEERQLDAVDRLTRRLKF